MALGGIAEPDAGDGARRPHQRGAAVTGQVLLVDGTDDLTLGDDVRWGFGESRPVTAVDRADPRAHEQR